jgi:hypothetical protein
MFRTSTSADVPAQNFVYLPGYRKRAVRNTAAPPDLIT